jgi:DNA invertase Pin-like site-specific DNA recombinase
MNQAKVSKGGRPRVSVPMERVMELRRAGLPWRAVARQTGLGVTTIRRACRALLSASQACQNSSQGLGNG